MFLIMLLIVVLFICQVLIFIKVNFFFKNIKNKKYIGKNKIKTISE